VGRVGAEVSAIFSGGGIAGDALRAFDWSHSALGPPATWPVSLGAHVRAMLHTRQATCIFWGSEYVNLYNDGFIPLLGEKHPRAMGQCAREVWSDAWPVVGELLSGVLTRGEAVLFHEMLVPIVRGGRLGDAWWSYSYSPLFGDDGAVAGILVVATETTAEVIGKKSLEAAKIEVELARQELHGVFMQAPLPMALLKGPEHSFTLVNGPYVALVGGREVQGRALREVFTADEVGYYVPYLNGVYESGEPILLQEAPLRLVDASGIASDRFIDVGYYPYHDPVTGVPAGVLAIIHDVTDKVAARVRESQSRERAEAASRAKDEFLAVVSHELRNPLSAILGWSRMLQGETDPARVAKGLAVIDRNASAQAALIDDILEVSSIVAGKLLLEPRRVRVAAVVQNAVESIRPALRAKGIGFELVLEDEEIQLVVDPNRLQQVVWNLLSNAAKFTPEGGAVRAEVKRVDAHVLIRVTDTGKGITPEFLPFVFDRFRQADPSTTKRHGGLGLGLAIVRYLVELHGGRVEATSAGEGRGATFDVVLPVRAVEPREATENARTAATADRGGARAASALLSLRGIRVLVVDDQSDARELVATVLVGAGAQVVEASSAAEAMATLQTASVNVIVSDVGMPLEDGYSLLRGVRSNAATRDIPALALTAYARDEDRAEATAAGFDDHAAKPVDPDDLVQRVAALARVGNDAR
jgi:signal transduction histidine kinase/ActR/RegA family two-component response regulator